MTRRRQSGAALLLALSVTAIAAALAAAAVYDTTVMRQRATQAERQAQAWQLAAGVEAWAIAWLGRDDDRTPQWDDESDAWARPLPPTPFPGGQMHGGLTDLGGRFPLNALIDPSGNVEPVTATRFRRLVDEVLGLDPAIAEQVLDRLDADTTARPGGYESGASGGPIGHLSELRALPAVSEPAYRRLVPLISVLPGRPRINVNTAPAEVLMALDDGIEADLAERLAAPGRAPWSSVSAFVSEAELAPLDIDVNGLDVRSGGFRIVVDWVLDGQPMRFESTLVRGGRTGPVAGGATDVSRYHVRNRLLTGL